MAAYHLPDGYRRRERAQAALDPSPARAPYNLAALECALHERDVLLDLGCGTAHHLLALEAPEWRVGFDLPDVVVRLKRDHPSGVWVDVDLEHAQAFPMSAVTLERSVVLCADVIDAMARPDRLLSVVVDALRRGAASAVLATVDRERAPSPTEGPPLDPARRQEWTFEELEALVRDYRLRITDRRAYADRMILTLEA